MIFKIKFNIFTFLFRAFAYLADQTGGWAMFAKPKILFGTLVLGLGITACNAPSGNSFENVPMNTDTTKFIIKVKPDSVKVDTVAKAVTSVVVESIISCYVATSPEEVEIPPSFPGGTDSLIKFLSKNTHYPVIAIENGIQGTTYCSFTVNKNGKISDIKIVKGVDPILDKEYIRVLSIMPQWLPSDKEKELTVAFVAKLIEKNEKTDSIYLMRYTNADYEIKTVAVAPTKQTMIISCYAGTIISNNWNAYFSDNNFTLEDYIEKHLVYPEKAKKDSIEGTVICEFKVSKKGRISRVKVKQSVHPLLDKEAVRLIKSMPRWRPAHKNGKPVKSKTTLEIEFEL